MATASVVFLTFNDVYELFPDDDGRGGIAEFATLLKHVKARIPSETRVVVTLNGDFLWRSELNRKDKGAHMVDLLNNLGVEFVVLGNHEFDFGETTLLDLLPRATFATFGSNIRLRSTGQTLEHTTDSVVIPLANGLRLGMFGVCTVTTAADSFPSENVVFESEVAHARRCVHEMRSQGVDAIVALTHVRLPVDKLIAKQVPGIDMILGGHDHEPMSLFEGSTLIHKSGQDALWLGEIELQITKTARANRSSVAFRWGMHSNRGYSPDPTCDSILREYAHRVEREESSNGQRSVLGTSMTLLDGTRMTCRTQESNLGNFVADAIREEYDADVAIVNGGYIKGEKMHSAGLQITPKWISTILEIPNASVLIQMRAEDFRDAMLRMLSRYPAVNASFPQISGIYAVYNMQENPSAPTLKLFRDANHVHEIDGSCEIKVGTSDFMVNEMPGFHKSTMLVENGPLIPDLVAGFLQTRKQIAYPLREDRIVIME